jgi:hypothetical protein
VTRQPGQQELNKRAGVGRTHAGLAVTASRARVTSSSVRPQFLAAPSFDLERNLVTRGVACSSGLITPWRQARRRGGVTALPIGIVDGGKGLKSGGTQHIATALPSIPTLRAMIRHQLLSTKRFREYRQLLNCNGESVVCGKSECGWRYLDSSASRSRRAPGSRSSDRSILNSASCSGNCAHRESEHSFIREHHRKTNRIHQWTRALCL